MTSQPPSWQMWDEVRERVDATHAIHCYMPMMTTETSSIKVNFESLTRGADESGVLDEDVSNTLRRMQEKKTEA